MHSDLKKSTDGQIIEYLLTLTKMELFRHKVVQGHLQMTYSVGTFSRGSVPFVNGCHIVLACLFN